jgi:hypothetical protein
MDEDGKFIAIEAPEPEHFSLICGLPRMLLANESQTVKNTASKPMNYNKGIPFRYLPCVPNQVLEEDQPLSRA